MSTPNPICHSVLMFITREKKIPCLSLSHFFFKQRHIQRTFNTNVIVPSTPGLVRAQRGLWTAMATARPLLPSDSGKTGTSWD